MKNSLRRIVILRSPDNGGTTKNLMVFLYSQRFFASFGPSDLSLRDAKEKDEPDCRPQAG